MATIGIDVTALATPVSGGIGTSQYQTMRALAALDSPHRFVMYAARPPVVPFSRRPLDLPWPLRLGAGLTARSNIVWMQTGVDRLLAEDRVDVFWGPRHLLPFLARGIAKVATVHDLWGRYYPGQQPWPNRTANRVLIFWVVARADVVVAPSSATARDVARFCGPVRGGVRVVQWGVDTAVFRALPPRQMADALARLGIGSPFLLALDVHNPRKSFPAVLRAVAQLPSALRETVQVVALGRPRATAKAPEWRSEAGVAALGGRLHLLGDVSTDDLVALYCGALALVYPSLYEGFGMPVLEAMACGCPVITSDRSALPEVAGDAALLVEPSRPDRLAEAIATLATDEGERARLVTAGSARAMDFTWRRTAEGMMAAFEDAVAVRAGGRR